MSDAPIFLSSPLNPPLNCATCSRLYDFRTSFVQENPDWHSSPVGTWFPNINPANKKDYETPPSQNTLKKVKLLIIGMAPGLRGANRTGRPFTGDYAGDLLYATLLKFGFAKGNYKADPNDGLKLIDCAITNAVRCVPPQNKPLGAEVNNCRPYLENTFQMLPNLKIVLTLGKIAHDTTLRTLNQRVAAFPFKHKAIYEMEGFKMISSYHCSRYNTNTKVLTTQMFEEVFAEIRQVTSACSF